MAFQGKVALVTSGGNTAGIDNARRLAREGAGLALHYDSTRSKDQAQRFRDDIRRTYPTVKVSLHRGDLSSPPGVELLFKDVLSEHRKIDIVVNSSGVVLNNEKLFAYSVFVDGQKNKWNDRYAEVQRLQATS